MQMQEQDIYTIGIEKPGHVKKLRKCLEELSLAVVQGDRDASVYEWVMKLRPRR